LCATTMILGWPRRASNKRSDLRLFFAFMLRSDLALWYAAALLVRQSPLLHQKRLAWHRTILVCAAVFEKRVSWKRVVTTDPLSSSWC